MNTFWKSRKHWALFVVTLVCFAESKIMLNTHFKIVGLMKFSIIKRIRSFKYALQGLRALLKFEHNSWIHLFAACCAIALGLYCTLSPVEWSLIVICIALVFMTEIFNTSIERLADFISPEWHTAIKHVKDLSAAAVLVCALAAVVIGLLIFVPKLISL